LAECRRKALGTRGVKLKTRSDEAKRRALVVGTYRATHGGASKTAIVEFQRLNEAAREDDRMICDDCSGTIQESIDMNERVLALPSNRRNEGYGLFACQALRKATSLPITVANSLVPRSQLSS
jgi:hypothetical protein